MKIVLSVVAACGVASASLANPTVYITNSFAQNGFINAVSNEGTAVGSTSTSEVGVWNPMNNLFANIGGAALNGAPSISDDGRYIGGTAAGSDGKFEMGRYDRNTSSWTTFGGTGGFSGTTRSSAWGISPDGKTVGGYGYGAPTGTGTFTGVRPAAWKEGVGMMDLSFAPTASSTNRVNAASNNGMFAGVARYPTSSSAVAGVYWGAGVGSQQGMTFSGGFLGEANEISADGKVVAGHGTVLTRDSAAVRSSRPYMYNTVTGATTLIDSIAGLNGNPITSGVGSIDGLLTGLTGNAQTAIGFFRGRSTSNTPLIDKVWGFIWTSGGGVMSFDQYALSLGITDTGTYYYVPTAISNDGSVIAGYRYLRSGGLVFDSFMITSIPAPSTLAFLGLPLVLGARRRR